jgi:hypothetical protein
VRAPGLQYMLFTEESLQAACPQAADGTLLSKLLDNASGRTAKLTIVACAVSSAVFSLYTLFEVSHDGASINCSHGCAFKKRASLFSA